MIDTAHTARPTAAPQARPPAMSPGLVLTRALLACAVAITAGLTITYLARVTLNLDAFQNPGTTGGFPNSGALTVGIIVATLLAVVVLELLRQVSPRPFAAFAVIMALGYVAFFCVSAFVTSGLTASQIAGQLVVCLPLAIVIAALASWTTGVYPDTPGQ